MGKSKMQPELDKLRAILRVIKGLYICLPSTMYTFNIIRIVSLLCYNDIFVCHWTDENKSVHGTIVADTKK